MCLGIPGEVIQLEERDGLRFGKVRFAGITRDVCLDCLDQVAVGEYVLVHVGMAISKVDREEAERSYRTLLDLRATDELTPEKLVEAMERQR